MRDLLHALVDDLMPDTCALCGVVVRPRAQDLLCDPCRRALPFNNAPCPICGLPDSSSRPCGACLIRPPTSGIAVVPLVHRDDARHLVARFKFHRGMREGRVLALQMTRQARRVYAGAEMPEGLVPVPLSWRSHVQRGYNQALELCRHLSRRLGIPIHTAGVRRRHGRSQRDMTRAQRLALSRRAFAIRRPCPYAHIAIVDDVLTTGSTVRALAAALEQREPQLERIDVWCATRAPP